MSIIVLQAGAVVVKLRSAVGVAAVISYNTTGRSSRSQLWYYK